MRRVRSILLVLAVAVLPLLAQKPAVDAVRFQVAGIEGRTVGALYSLDTEGVLELQDEKRIRLNPESWYSLRRIDFPGSPLPDGPHLVTTADDCLSIQNPRLENERLTFEHPDLNGGKTCTLSLGAVRLLWWTNPSEEPTEVLRRQLLRENRKADLTILANGDRVVGVPTALDAFRLNLQIADGNRSLEVKQLACLALNPSLAEPLPAKGRAYQIRYQNRGGSDSSRVTLASLSSDGETLSGKTLFGATLVIPLARLHSITVLNGPALFLTDLQPTTTTQTPYLDVRWPVGLDSTPRLRDLRLGETTHDRGLSLMAGTSITYNLEGKYRRLEVTVGLDPRLGRAGAVRLEILRDGKPMSLEQPELIGWRQIRSISVDTTGVKELTLGVQPGRRGTVQGHVNWVEPRLVK